MRDEDLVIINCIMYDPTLDARLGESESMTLRQWADGFDWDAFSATMDTKKDKNGNTLRDKNGNPIPANDPPRYTGGMTEDDMRRIVASVQNDPTLSNATIVDVTRRDSGGNMATIISGGSAIVAYQGTAGDPEWMDDGLGGHVDVTDTPDQTNALRYFEQMRKKYNLDALDVYTTGHSKGGNLAMYVAIVSGQVDHCTNIDGQGFNRAFMLKYRLELQQAQNKLTTLANSKDYVNPLFGSVTMGSTIYTEDPGLDSDDFLMNHSPVTLLQSYLGADGKLHLRPESEQNAMIVFADQLTEYLAKYMTGDDFAVLCDTVMELKTHAIDASDMLMDTDGVVDVAATLLSVIKNGAWGALKEPYRSMFQDLFRLLGGFYQGGGLSPDAEWAIEVLLVQLGLDPKKVLGGDWLVTQVLAHLPPVPYWPQVRDFSESVKQELLEIVDLVTPDTSGWTVYEWIIEHLKDMRLSHAHLDFTDDDAARREYYQKAIDSRNMTKQQIEKIFQDVYEVDGNYANFAREIQSEAEPIKMRLAELSIQLEAAPRRVGGI